MLSLIFAFLEYAAGIFVGPPCPVSLHLGPLWTVGGEPDTRGSPTFYYYYYYCHYEGHPTSSPRSDLIGPSIERINSEPPRFPPKYHTSVISLGRGLKKDTKRRQDGEEGI